MKKFLTILALLVIVPVSMSWAYESKGEAYFGGFSTHGEEVTFGWSVGETSVLIVDTAKNYSVGLYKGYFSADREFDDIQGASSFLVVSRYIALSPKTTFSLSFGIGGLYQFKDGEDEANLDLMLKPAIKIFNFATIGLFGTWVPQKGNDASFFGLSLDITP